MKPPFIGSINKMSEGLKGDYLYINVAMAKVTHAACIQIHARTIQKKLLQWHQINAAHVHSHSWPFRLVFAASSAVFFRTAASRGTVQRAYYTQSRSRSILPGAVD